MPVPRVKVSDGNLRKEIVGNSKIRTKIQGRFFYIVVSFGHLTHDNVQLWNFPQHCHWECDSVVPLTNSVWVTLMSTAPLWMQVIGSKQVLAFQSGQKVWKLSKRCQILLVDGDTDFPVGRGTSLIKLQQVTPAHASTMSKDSMVNASNVNIVKNVNNVDKVINVNNVNKDSDLDKDLIQTFGLVSSFFCAWLLSGWILEHHPVTASELNQDQWS